MISSTALNFSSNVSQTSSGDDVAESSDNVITEYVVGGIIGFTTDVVVKTLVLGAYTIGIINANHVDASIGKTQLLSSTLISTLLSPHARLGFTISACYINARNSLHEAARHGDEGLVLVERRRILMPIGIPLAKLAIKSCKGMLISAGFYTLGRSNSLINFLGTTAGTLTSYFSSPNREVEQELP